MNKLKHRLFSNGVLYVSRFEDDHKTFDDKIDVFFLLPFLMKAFFYFPRISFIKIQTVKQANNKMI